MKNFSSDIQLIIQCCQHHTNSNDITSLISKIMDWETFIDLAFSHGVFPLVYKELKQYPTLIPQKVLSTMKTYNMDIVKQNMLMTAELIKVMKILEENDIETIAFKGPTLAQTAYGDITLRQYSDLDILIKEENLQKAYNILTQQYITTIKQKFLNNTLFLKRNSDIQLYNKKNNILIELHWKLFRTQFAISSKYNIQEIFKFKEELKIQNYTVHIFPTELLIVYLCMHGSKHNWERISWILDIALLINKTKNINWESMYKTAKKLNSEKMFFIGMELSYNLFNIVIPKKYLKNSNLISFIVNDFHTLPEDKSETLTNIESFKFHYHLQDSLLLKTSFLYNSLLKISDRDILEVNLPNKLSFLYLFIKIKRILKKYILKF